MSGRRLDIWSRAGDFGRRIIAERMVLGSATEISDGVSDGDNHNSDGTNEIAREDERSSRNIIWRFRKFGRSIRRSVDEGMKFTE